MTNNIHSPFEKKSNPFQIQTSFENLCIFFDDDHHFISKMSDLENMPIFDSKFVEAIHEGKKNEKLEKKNKKYCKGKCPKKCQKMKKMMKCMKMNTPPFYDYSIPPPFWGRTYLNNYLYEMPHPLMFKFKHFHIPCYFGMTPPPTFGFKHFYKHWRN